MLSMTGYIYKTFNHNSLNITFEIKCLNHRFLEYNFNFPSNFSKFEINLIKILKENFSRGTFYINIYLDKFIGDYQIIINEQLAYSLTKSFKSLIKKLKISKRIYISNILPFEGIIKIIPQNFPQELENFIFSSFENCLKELKENMKNEGEFLKKEINNYIKSIYENLNIIKQRSLEENSLILNKLKEKIKKLIDEQKIDEDRILQEAGIQQNKIDITEEITRLDSHLIYLKDLINSEKYDIGKKIDFICQEILREANTICSKSITTEIIYNAIEIKNQIEKIREQTRNIS
ncbi:MAG: YicC family protein [Spirochaetes bacterium]|nr:YicC family protein [Spirochaetota bacterium]